jgi:ATP-dependent exoDNAse (exonuclease V) alpha subunit
MPVASYHFTCKVISRSEGRSATGAAAYRSAQCVHDHRTGEVHDYARKRGVEYREIVTPAGAPTWAFERERLWNEAETAERRKNSTVAREFEVALPSELTATQRRLLAVRLARELVERHGFVADVSIHLPHREGDQRNHHAHILCTTRRLTPEGFAEKTRELDEKQSGEIVFWRGRWAALQNEHLKEHAHEARVDHRSLSDQGLDRAPTLHKGPALTALERRGVATEIGTRQRLELQREAEARLARAAELGRLERESAELSRSILDVTADLIAAKRERVAQLSMDRGQSAPTPRHARSAGSFLERVDESAERFQGLWTREREEAEKIRVQQERRAALERGQDLAKQHRHERSLTLDLG